MKLLFSFSAILLLLQLTSAFHFYLRNGERECFPQESPENYIVKGTYTLEEYKERELRVVEDKSLVVQITVDDIAKNQRIMNQKGSNTGKFTFTVVNGGRQNICLEVKSNNPNWQSTSKVKVTLDLAVKDDREVEKTSEKISFLHSSLIELNNKISFIRKEQNYQRERETSFNKTNEAINSRIFFWVFVQIFLIIGVCYWQLRHLRRFFEAKKLV